MEGALKEKAKANLAAGGGDKKSEDAKSGLAKKPKAIDKIDVREGEGEDAFYSQ